MQNGFNSITATNIINHGAKATYHAGAKVLLLPGFVAAAGSGSVFKGYMGCTGTFSALANSPDALAQYDYRYDAPSTSPESAPMAFLR